MHIQYSKNLNQQSKPINLLRYFDFYQTEKVNSLFNIQIIKTLFKLMKSKEYSCFSEFIIQRRGFELLNQIRQKINTTNKLSLADIPALDEDDPIMDHGESLFNRIQQQVDENFTSYNIWKSLYYQFKCQILTCYFCVQVQFMFTFFISLIMNFLFYSFKSGEITTSFIYVSLLAFVYITQSFFGQNGWRLVEILSIQIKGAMIYGLFKKTLTLSYYSMGSSQIGTLTNAITQFHDILQNRAKFIFQSFSAPLAIISLTTLLYTIVGWPSLVGVSTLILCQFLHYHYAHYNSGFLEHIQKWKDSRLDLLFQVISGFRYVKMQLWQKMLLERILGVRQTQMKSYLKYGGGMSLQIALSEGVSTACMLIILGLTHKHGIDITSIQVILTVLIILQIKLLVIQSSYGISCFYQLKVVIDNIRQIYKIKAHRMIKLKQEDSEIVQQSYMKMKENSNAIIEVLNLSIYKNQSSQQQNKIIQNISLNIQKGDFIGIYGSVGSGKSTFLKCLASQIPYYKGYVDIKCQTSLAQQEPIIFSETIRENILFGKQMNQQLYRNSLRWACLNEDLNNLLERDQTLIEQGGNNLSGGQRTRIGLARCFYADKPVILLDDPLSSIDSLVAKQIMKNLTQLQALGKTIVLVSHLTSYFIKLQKVYIIETKGISATKIVKRSNDQFQILSESQHQDSSNESVSQVQLENLKIFSNNLIQNKQDVPDIKPKNLETITVNQDSAIVFGFWKTFFNYIYINKWNRLVFTVTFLLYILSETLYTLVILLLNQYDTILAGGTTTVGAQSQYWMYLQIMSATIFILQLLRTFMLSLSIQLANHTLHQNGIKHYFSLDPKQADSLGSKDVLSRFSSDLGLLDSALLPQLSNAFIVFFIAVIQSIVISIYNPIILIFYVAIAIPCFIWNRYCYIEVPTVKELDLVFKSPIIGIFSETIKGLTQINMFKAEQHSTSKLKEHLGRSLRVSYCYRRMYRVYCSYGVHYAATIISCAYFVLAATLTSSDISTFTFAAVFMVQINQTISFIIANFIKITSILSSVQRLLIFGQIKKESNNKQTDQSMNKSEQMFQMLQYIEVTQPNQFILQSRQVLNKKISLQDSFVQTAILLENINLRYNPTSQIVLKKINLKISRGQRVALIGRTGSGKSSFIQLIYRLIEPQPGSIYTLEGANALKMPINELRSKFACIPQTPFLFSDTLRKNVDPFNERSQEQIVEALVSVNIWQKLQKLQVRLDSELDKVFGSFSMGEKQLICLARAMLQHKQYLILDEATSNIDLEADQIMQKLIREKFKDTTIIAVAHRLQTIADFDKIIVLSKGKILEMGQPKELYDKKGEFYQMVNSSSKHKEIVLKKIYQNSLRKI